jgi:murein DD-endopeptidase MepM/ murein hydrolase activator NlpD
VFSTPLIEAAYDRLVTIEEGVSRKRRAGRLVLRTLLAAGTGATLALLPLVSAGPAMSTLELMTYVPQYPHHAYGYQLALTRLQDNAPARDWLAAADRALLAAQTVPLPFTARGAEAAGYSFSVPTGRRLTVSVTSEPREGDLFVDLFRVTGARHERVGGAVPRGDSAPFFVEVLEGADYILRVQPALGAAGPYEVGLAATPLLGFPVDGVDARAIWSGFGAERDGGRRAHRGVDIFAPRGTPALAAIDGWVTRVETTRVGGNVVWLQPLLGTMRIYYAHLDEQWVRPGDFVRAGQAVGTVGNTGNARTTPPHLHFGVYVRRQGMRGGARDPAEFLR